MHNVICMSNVSSGRAYIFACHCGQLLLDLGCVSVVADCIGLNAVSDLRERERERESEREGMTEETGW